MENLVSGLSVLYMNYCWYLQKKQLANGLLRVVLFYFNLPVMPLKFPKFSFLCGLDIILAAELFRIKFRT